MPGLVVVALILVWAAHNGGYDVDTWYWGALVVLALLAATRGLFGNRTRRWSRPTAVAVALFAAYVAWSYASIAWASSPGDALTGSNRALLYLLLFVLMLRLPWTVESAVVVLLVFALGVGTIGIVLLFRLTSADHIAGLVIGGRLAAPTGYFNATAALFTAEALTATVLATRRELPGLLRGLLLALACAGLQLGVIVQSRGWLFTLPLIAIAAIAVVRDRLRVACFALVPIAGALVPLHRLLRVYQQSSHQSALNHAAVRAGHSALLVCAGVLVIGSLLAWADALRPLPPLSRSRRRAIGAATACIAVAVAVVGGVTATHGHPFRFVARQWRGFSHTQTRNSPGSHFADVGSGRYDFWRVSLDAVAAHPVGGLGQDNFADYYVTRRRTWEEPKWAHSLEMRLLVHTGIVGLVLFSVFLAAALIAALGPAQMRESKRPSTTACIALLPLVVWLIHGSVDWFWEIPALAGPALGFLGLAIGLRTPETPVENARAAHATRRLPRLATVLAGVAAVAGATVLLGFPYLSAREVAAASSARATNPAQAVRDLRSASKLNPLSADPARLAGTIALQTGNFANAERWYGQATSREPKGWFAWLGSGLAASALGERTRARQDLQMAASINPRDPVIQQTLTSLRTGRPLSVSEAFRLLREEG